MRYLTKIVHGKDKLEQAGKDLIAEATKIKAVTPCLHCPLFHGYDDVGIELWEVRLSYFARHS